MDVDCEGRQNGHAGLGWQVHGGATPELGGGGACAEGMGRRT